MGAKQEATATSAVVEGTKGQGMEHQMPQPMYITLVRKAEPEPDTPRESRHGCMLWMLSMFTTIMTVLLLTRLVIYSVDQATECSLVNLPKSDELSNATGLKIVEKAVWTKQPDQKLFRLHHPTLYVVVAHTGGKVCHNATECVELLQELRLLHMHTLHQPEIGWNFLIGGDGLVYEGRGWDASNFILGFMRKRSIGVCFVGNYVESEPTPAQLLALQELLQRGLVLGKIAPYYMLLAHRQVETTFSPGEKILETIDTWPHRCLRKCWSKK